MKLHCLVKVATYFFVMKVSLIQAHSLNIEELAVHPYWLKLGHYSTSLVTGYKTPIQKDGFYLAENGRYSPFDELKVTVSMLYNQNYNIAVKMRCLYPARYVWLEKMQGKLGDLSCPAFNTWYNKLKPVELSFVFASQYMNDLGIYVWACIASYKFRYK